MNPRKNAYFWISSFSICTLFLGSCSQLQSVEAGPPGANGSLAPLYGNENPSRIPGKYIIVMEGNGVAGKVLPDFQSRKGVNISDTLEAGTFQAVVATLTDNALVDVRRTAGVKYVEADAVVHAFQDKVNAPS